MQLKGLFTRTLSMKTTLQGSIVGGKEENGN